KVNLRVGHNRACRISHHTLNGAGGRRLGAGVGIQSENGGGAQKQYSQGRKAQHANLQQYPTIWPLGRAYETALGPGVVLLQRTFVAGECQNNICNSRSVSSDAVLRLRSNFTLSRAGSRLFEDTL